ncbi:MAG: phosphatidylcholine/phosphatidylserine synthase [Alphaproteobacteria bacterium]|nr:phosphatidylcholine/phosphatidylserine synthase [Alphaproteobacteria bacterium]
MKPQHSTSPQWLTPETALFLRHALPNGVTILALCFGLTALVFANDLNITAAIACVLIAAILDACDGRVARATGCASKFGAELDSLSDVVCFGAVPAFILYQWGLSAYGAIGWIVCLSVAAACALRLARFNVATDAPGRPSWANHFFTGVPAPAGAFLALLPIYAANSETVAIETASFMALFAVPITAGLMVSSWPTFSAKAISRKALRLLFVPSLAATVALAFGLMLVPWLTLTLAAVVYLWTLPISKWRHERHRRRSATA